MHHYLLHRCETTQEEQFKQQNGSLTTAVVCSQLNSHSLEWSDAQINSFFIHLDGIQLIAGLQSASGITKKICFAGVLRCVCCCFCTTRSLLFAANCLAFAYHSPAFFFLSFLPILVQRQISRDFLAIFFLLSESLFGVFLLLISIKLHGERFFIT